MLDFVLLERGVKRDVERAYPPDALRSRFQLFLVRLLERAAWECEELAEQLRWPNGRPKSDFELLMEATYKDLEFGDIVHFRRLDRLNVRDAE